MGTDYFPSFAGVPALSAAAYPGILVKAKMELAEAVRTSGSSAGLRNTRDRK
jgi:hypothetical protein